MSPSYFGDGSYARMFRVYMGGYLDESSVDYAAGVRPVLNLKADTVISGGDGTADLPFVVQTN